MARQRSRGAPSPGHVLAALDRIRAEVDALRDLIADDLRETAALPSTSAGDWRKLKDAARELKLHPETLARQARKHGFGRRVPGGSWRIDMQRHAAWIAGQPFEPLLSEDVEKSRVLSDDADGRPAAD